jgi:hypothetical protein
MKTYRVKPEYYDLWQATPENDIVAEEFVLQMTHPNEWDKPLDELLEQLDEISE